jgi:hypothetical protein
MDRNKLKSYAPAARRDFIKAVSEKANLLGLSEKKIEPAILNGDVAVIMGKTYPKYVYDSRLKLVSKIEKEGFDRVIERIAYTWFNRFLALRFMEIHSYLGHGYRVLSNPTGRPTPEILENADRVHFGSLNKDRVIELKLAGDRDPELYSMLLVAQCNEIHKSMPFLFEAINDETELLLPDNLLHTDSIIRKLVNEIPEEDWQEIEIIGWIYQFYISEKKAEVIGSVVKSEDIPAATQLFTPNWIVKYMVQNSLGRKWLATYPDSNLRSKMEYYIEPAEQTPDVQEKLAEITPDSLDPEEMTLMDPACGSGHILVEAYDIFKEIYLERGYRTRDIPKLILETNLFGLDIDDRAAQLAGFALLMKARKDDSRVLTDPPKQNVMSIQSSEDINASELVNHLHEFDSDIDRAAIVEIISLFKLGKVAGSLIRIPDNQAPKLSSIKKVIEKGVRSSNLFVNEAAKSLKPIIEQAMLLGSKYDCVVANPPYMNSSYMTPVLKKFASDNCRLAKSDIFGMFVNRGALLTSYGGYLGFVTPYVWMFLSSHENFRRFILDNLTITTLTQLEYNAFEPACVPVCVYTMMNVHLADFEGDYIKLSDFRGSETQAPRTLEAIGNFDCGWRHRSTTSTFHKIPGSPIAYWAGRNVSNVFANYGTISSVSRVCSGLTSGDKQKFVRLWYEVSIREVYFNTKPKQEDFPNKGKWFPFNAGGEARRWYGNRRLIINWQNDGEEIKRQANSTIRNSQHYFKKGITWTDISSSFFSARVLDEGFIFENTGSLVLPRKDDLLGLLSYLCSKVAYFFINLLNPTLHFGVGEVSRLPWRGSRDICARVNDMTLEAISIAHKDWNFFETSWDFKDFPWLTDSLKSDTTEQSFRNWQSHLDNQIKRMMELETENNRLWIEAYGLQDELDPEVPEDQITLARPDVDKDVKRLISYSIGCMMGRYSLDEPGLIYANSGNIGIDPTKYQAFSADDDGILPITDIEWFPDDVTVRFVEFIKTVWSPDTLEENLNFIAESLTGRQVSDSREVIRKYISSNFYKDHLQTYKNRPIYWLFSSGKQKAFECLVYLHRYNESTLSRMRSEYVIPLQGKINGRIQLLEKDLGSGSKGSEAKVRKELEALKKKQTELIAFDENLRHYADMRISLDLDDGVKVNYGKFGNLLAAVDKVTGKK